jgi:hypothetical protein
MAIGKGLGALVVSSAFLWQIAERAGPQDCTAIVHVTEPDVDVSIDEADFHLATWTSSPLVCPLFPGRHTLRMWRRGRTLYEEAFVLEGGQELVLTAWDVNRPASYSCPRDSMQK